MFLAYFSELIHFLFSDVYLCSCSSLEASYLATLSWWSSFDFQVYLYLIWIRDQRRRESEPECSCWTSFSFFVGFSCHTVSYGSMKKKIWNYSQPIRSQLPETKSAFKTVEFSLPKNTLCYYCHLCFSVATFHFSSYYFLQPCKCDCLPTFLKCKFKDWVLGWLLACR